MIEIRTVRGRDDERLWLDLRNRVADDPLASDTRQRARELAPDRVELLGFLDGEPAAAAFVSSNLDDASRPNPVAIVFVLRELRRRGVGSALYAALSLEARRLQKTGLDTFAPIGSTGRSNWIFPRGSSWPRSPTGRSCFEAWTRSRSRRRPTCLRPIRS